MYYNDGYDGFSMSINARQAYERDEMPKSKWCKSDIMEVVKKTNPNVFNDLKRVKADIVLNHLLKYMGWHHTSKYYNRTKFYSIDFEKIKALTKDDIANWSNEDMVKTEPIIEPDEIIHGDFYYYNWIGNKKHPRPVEDWYINVDIERYGDLYVVKNESGKTLIKKRIDSIGTKVVPREKKEASTSVDASFTLFVYEQNISYITKIHRIYKSIK